MSETMPERVGRRDVAAIAGSRRARLARTSRRIALGLLALVVALVASGLAYQTIAEARDRRAYPPPGRLVDVGGYRLHLHLLGADKAGPTVILDAGSGSMSAQWG